MGPRVERRSYPLRTYKCTTINKRVKNCTVLRQCQSSLCCLRPLYLIIGYVACCSSPMLQRGATQDVMDQGGTRGSFSTGCSYCAQSRTNRHLLPPRLIIKSVANFTFRISIFYDDPSRFLIYSSVTCTRQQHSFLTFTKTTKFVLNVKVDDRILLSADSFFRALSYSWYKNLLIK